MNFQYKDYIIQIVDDPIYTLNSTDNLNHYKLEYFGGEDYTDRQYPNSKHGIRVFKNEIEIASAIVCEIGGVTTIHKDAVKIIEDTLFICCSDKIYALNLPGLELLWKNRLDPATCFGIYNFHNDLIIHGELQITRIDYKGIEKWNFGTRDIFVTQDGSAAFTIESDFIKLKDWKGYKYTLNANGKEIF